MPAFTISVVSHNQGSLVTDLLADLEALYKGDFDVLLTLNDTNERYVPNWCSFPIRVIRNVRQRGFGANHNTAFALSDSPYFVVVNPDIRLAPIDFGKLFAPFCDRVVGACGPMVVNPKGEVDDNARKFPSLGRLFYRFLTRRRPLDYEIGTDVMEVDWLAGMFIAFRSEAFRETGGFDEKYFLYYEDVDIGRRLRTAGLKTVLVPEIKVVHAARRASHRNNVHARWHARSAFRYFVGL